MYAFGVICWELVSHVRAWANMLYSQVSTEVLSLMTKHSQARIEGDLLSWAKMLYAHVILSESLNSLQV
jgi:hypothetical protein